jgi:hypothetical protein
MLWLPLLPRAKENGALVTHARRCSDRINPSSGIRYPVEHAHFRNSFHDQRIADVIVSFNDHYITSKGIGQGYFLA